MPKWFIILALIIMVAVIGGCAKRNTAYQEDEWLNLEKQVEVIGDPLDISFDDNYMYIALDQGGVSTIRRSDYVQKWYPFITAADGSSYALTRVPRVNVVSEHNRLFLNETGAPDRIIYMDTSVADTLTWTGNKIGESQGIQDMAFNAVSPAGGAWTISGGYCGSGKAYITLYNEEFGIVNDYNITPPATASGLFIAGNYIYIAIQQRGLAIYDRTTHLLVSEIAIPGSALKVKISGNLAFIASRQGGLNVVDIANPAAPVLLGSFATSNFTTAVDVKNSKAAICSGSGGVYLFDISTPSQPVLLQNLTSCGYANTAKFVGDKLVVTTRDQGVLVYKVR